MLCTLLLCVQAGAQGLSAEKRTEISDMLTRILDREVRGGKTRITRVVDAGNRLTLTSYEIQRLRMENQLLRDFLRFTGRK